MGIIMGPLVEDTVEDLRNIQRSLWEVSSAGSACSGTHGCSQSLLLTQRRICPLVFVLKRQVFMAGTVYLSVWS